jgi:hypothetical protein
MHLRGVAAWLALAIGLLGGGRTAAAQLVINEVDYDTPGTDNAEFIEIKNTGGSAVALSTYSIRLIDGPGGSTYGTFALPALSLAAGDYFVLCANANRTPNCDLDVTPDTNLMQNGADAIELVDGTTVVDTLSYDGTVAGHVEGTGSIDDTDTTGKSLDRVPDGTDSNNNSADFDTRCATPGATNSSAQINCSICGSGTTEQAEQCDDGGLLNGTTASCCTASCTYQPATTSCGDGGLTDCSDPDTCNATGVCQANHYALGTGCGITADTECTDPDTCDGNGTCLSNHEPNTTQCTDTSATDCLDARCNGTGGCNQTEGFEALNSACGNTGDTDCDNPDTCDATGTCLENPEPITTTCGSPTDDECTDPDKCDGIGGCDAHDEPDTTQCTDDTPTDCMDARCDGGGTCDQTAGFENLGNACGSTTDTDCDNPDTCNATGTCLTNLAGSGTPCGSGTDDTCTDPDTCNGSGTCLVNNVSNGTPCGSSSNTTCTDPDTCVAGVCASHDVPDNTVCGDPIDNACTDPDAARPAAARRGTPPPARPAAAPPTTSAPIPTPATAAAPAWPTTRPTAPAAATATSATAPRCAAPASARTPPTRAAPASRATRRTTPA